MLWVLNMQRFWIDKDFEYAKVNVKQGCDMPEYAKIIPEYVWFCLNMSEYAWICVNMPKSV